jgi:hypothetical protein
MSKELKFVTCQPDDTYYTWQVHNWLESLREIGKSDKAIVIVFTPDFREFNEKWKEVEALYPEAEFAYIKDEHKISKLISVYIPIIRPYSLMRYFNEHPDMVSKAVFYCDSDIVFTENFNIDAYIDDDICYLSDTNSYINASYFDSKTNDVLPEKLEEYKTMDVLAAATSLVGITREIAEKNNLHSGGAQYLLKNIGGSFWDKVLSDCINLKIFLSNINKNFFANESKGFQSWCTDMWAVLWNLWMRDQETMIVKELDFAWSTDNIKKLDDVGILHNAGVTANYHTITPMFYKGVYHAGKDPFKDSHLKKVIDNESNKQLCNNYYLQKLLNIKQKYNLDYGHN